MHSLGRITCVSVKGKSSTQLTIVDGQQRNTTVILLLATIRDVALSRSDENFPFQFNLSKRRQVPFSGRLLTETTGTLVTTFYTPSLGLVYGPA